MEELQGFLTYLQKEKKYSEYTLKAYQQDISSFFIFIEDKSPKEVMYSDVREWVVELNGSGVTNRTVNRKVSALRSFFRYLLMVGCIDLNPLQLHKSLKVEKSIQIPFSRKEIDDVRRKFEGVETFSDCRDFVVIELLYSLGLRRSELVNLGVGDIDFYERQIKVKGKGGKERKLPLVSCIMELLKDYLARREIVLAGRLVSALLVNDSGEKINESFVYRLINTYFSDVTSKVKKSPHMLRHSFATHLLENGADINSIKELLGHESLLTTQQYTGVNFAELKEVYKKSHPRMRKK